jgi:uncharacterized membrane protein YtjA (UPF0391 family)
MVEHALVLALIAMAAVALGFGAIATASWDDEQD